MNASAESTAFANNIVSVSRLQRHLGARIIIATQDPTLSPALLSLCSVTIVHRFTSPSWLKVLQSHLSTYDSNEPSTNIRQLNLLQSIVGLRTGEALLFAPTIADKNEEASSEGSVELPYIKIRVRARISTDGGKSLLAV